METFSKAELQWIYRAVEDAILELEKFLNADCEEYDPLIASLAHLRMEGLTVIKTKLERTLENGSKRIAIT